MWKWLARFATVVSLVLCLSTMALWTRSYWWFDDLEWAPDEHHRWLFRSAEGRLYVQCAFTPGVFFGGPSVELWSGNLSRAQYAFLPFDWQFAGFAYGHMSLNTKNNIAVFRHLSVPHAVATGLFAILPAFAIRRGLHHRRASKRLAVGLCPRCGYDLRASPEKCPECGTIVPQKPKPISK